MYCEMCGKDEKLFLSEVEGVKLKVCKNCAGFGKTIRPIAPKLPKKKEKAREKRVKSKEKEEIEIIKDVTADYPKIIRKAREKLNLKQEEFARKINEKESIVHKIESGKFKPSIKLAQKLEKLLNIKLIEESIDEETPISQGSGEAMTIGDLLQAKK